MSTITKHYKTSQVLTKFLSSRFSWVLGIQRPMQSVTERVRVPEEAEEGQEADRPRQLQFANCRIQFRSGLDAAAPRTVHVCVRRGCVQWCSPHCRAFAALPLPAGCVARHG